MGDLYVDERMILKWILDKKGVNVSAGLRRISTGSNGEIL
jgi:hypothetical protein